MMLQHSLSRVPFLEVMSNHKMAGLDPQKSPSPRLTQQPGTIHIGRRVKTLEGADPTSGLDRAKNQHQRWSTNE